MLNIKKVLTKILQMFKNRVSIYLAGSNSAIVVERMGIVAVMHFVYGRNMNINFPPGQYTVIGTLPEQYRPYFHVYAPVTFGTRADNIAVVRITTSGEVAIAPAAVQGTGKYWWINVSWICQGGVVRKIADRLIPERGWAVC